MTKNPPLGCVAVQCLLRALEVEREETGEEEEEEEEETAASAAICDDKDERKRERERDLFVTTFFTPTKKDDFYVRTACGLHSQ